MIRRLLILILATVCLLAGLIAWVLMTESGLSASLSMAQQWLPGLSVNQVTGRLNQSATLEGIVYRVDDQENYQIESLSIRLSPLALLRGRLVVDQLFLDGLELTAGKAAEGATFQLPELVLPIPISITDLRLSRVTRLNELSQSTTLVSDLSASLAASRQQVIVKQLRVQTDDETGFELQGTLALNGEDATNMAYRWHAMKNGKVLSAEGQIKGNLAELMIDQQMLEPFKSSQTIKATHLLNDLTWEAQANLSNVILSDLATSQQGRITTATLIASGTKQQATLTLQGQLAEHALDEFTLAIEANSNALDTWFVNAQLSSSNKAKLALTGSLQSPFDALKMDLQGSWQALFWPLNKEAGFLHSRKGQFSLLGDADQYRVKASGDLALEQQQTTFSIDIDATTERLMLKQFELKGLDGVTTASGEVQLSSDEPVYQLQAKLNKLTIPRALSGRMMVVNNGTVSLSGPMSVPMLKAQAAVLVDAKAINVTLSSQLDAAGNNKLDLLVKAGNGTAKFNGSAQWADSFKLNGVVTLTKFDPSVLAKEWPGALSGGWQMSVLKQQDKSVDVQVRALNIRGPLRQRALKIVADANYVNGQLIVPSLQINTAQSMIRAKGYFKKQLNFDWSIDSPNLADFHPELAGQLQTSGTLLGKASEPLIRAKLAGKNISYSELIRLATVDSDVRMEMLETGRIDTTVKFSGLSVNDVHDINGNVAIAGRLNEHTIAIQANDKTSTASARASGGYAKRQWQGKFNQIQMTQGTNTPWQADKFGTVVLTKNSVNIAQHCLQAEGSRFCLQARYAETGHWYSQFNLAAIPVSIAQAYSRFIAPLHGELNGDIKLNGYESYPTEGSGQLSVQNARVLVSDSEAAEKKFIALNKLDLSYQLKDSKSFIDIILAPDLPGVSPLTGRLMMADIKTVLLNPEKSPLSGYLKTTVDDLSVIDTLHTDYDKLKGQLKLDLTVSGTVKQTSINGQLALTDGQVYLPRLGLSLEALNLMASGDLSKGIKLDYHVKSGKGQLNGDALINQTKQGWSVLSSLKGDNIEVLNLPEAYVVASPDLQFTLNDKTSQLSGTVRVPTAELVPVQFNASVRASDDVVIINGPVQKEGRSVATDFNVNVLLGDKVKVNGLGFGGRLTGKLLISGNSKKLLLGTGDIFIKDGSYEAYGQKLDIDNGKIQFTGGAIENPSIDIKATRKSGKVLAGLQLTGTVDDPLVALFSRPSMSDDNILSYLMIGRPLAGASAADAAMLASAATGLGIKGGNMLGEQIASTFGLDSFAINGNGGGDTALQIGKYLSPKLYLSYGIGLFEPVSTVNLNYELNKNWSVKTESGVETGVDILYSRER